MGNLLSKVKSDWPQMLWVFLLSALAVNILFLLWPQSPGTLVISPHPDTMRTYTDPLPVLVEAPSSPDGHNYLLVQMASDGKGGKPKVIDRISTGTKAGKPHKELPAEKINLNQASPEQLQQLPGIGPKMAERIVNFRQTHGPFHTVNQLLAVPGIGPKKLEKMMPYCTL